MKAITRPPVRWHGGKFLMSRTILPYLPEHRLYTEAFGGGAGVLLHKPRSHAEIYNDLMTTSSLRDWHRIAFRAMADGARPRTEVLWLNPACAAALDREGRAYRQLEMLVPA
jgi:hypothetical protein